MRTPGSVPSSVRRDLRGNALKLVENPIRLVSGLVRGGVPEQLVTAVNPTLNRGFFEAAHELIMWAWTPPGNMAFWARRWCQRFGSTASSLA